VSDLDSEQKIGFFNLLIKAESIDFLTPPADGPGLVDAFPIRSDIVEKALQCSKEFYRNHPDKVMNCGHERSVRLFNAKTHFEVELPGGGLSCVFPSLVGTDTDQRAPPEIQEAFNACLGMISDSKGALVSMLTFLLLHYMRIPNFTID
jgi:hypothetical protein